MIFQDILFIQMKTSIFQKKKLLAFVFIFVLFSLTTTPGVSKYRDQISQENIEEIIRTDRRAGNLVNKLRNVTGGGREVECVPPLDAEIFR